MKRNIKAQHWQQFNVMKATRIHFFYVVAYMASIIVFDSWNLITHTQVANRWTAAGILIILNTVLWYLARVKFSRPPVYVVMLMLLILADIIFASYNIYWDRGIASQAIILFAVPLILAAMLRSKSTLMAATVLCATAYSMSAVLYFNYHYGEAFRVELYGYVTFYCAMFFVLAGLLWVVLTPDENRIT